MPYSRQDILTQNINTYPNNNSGQITPDSVKSFNQNWIQSLVFTDQTGSMQINSASFAISASEATHAASATSATSASFASTASFLLGSVANAVTAQTASFTPNAFVSASVNLQTITLTKGDGSATNLLISVSGSVASSSYASNSDLLDGLDSSAFAKTGSNSFKANQVISGSLTFYDVAGNTAVTIYSQGVTSQRLKVDSQVQANEFFGNLTGDVIGTASFATTASYALNSAVNTGNLVTTSSFNAYTASAATTFATKTEVNTFTASVATTYATKAEVNSYTGSTNAFTASIKTFTGSIQTQVNALQAATSSYATLSGNNNFVGVNNFGTITASNALITNLHTVTVTSSVIYNTGSNQLGDNASDTQTLWGTVDMKTGPVKVTGSLNVSAGITGSLFGNASTATSASYASTAQAATSASYAATAQQATSASYASTAQQATSASYASTAQQASSASFATTASFALNVSQVATGSFATTGSNTFNGNQIISGSVGISGSLIMNGLSPINVSHVNANDIQGVELRTNSGTTVATFGQGGGTGATFAGQVNAVAFSGSGALVTGVISSSYASTAQQATSASYASTSQTSFSSTSASYATNAGNAATATTATSASYATNAGNAATATSATSASYANNAGNAATATSASYSSTAQQATSASFATTASYALNAGAGGVQAGDIYSYSFLLMGA